MRPLPKAGLLASMGFALICCAAKKSTTPFKDPAPPTVASLAPMKTPAAVADAALTYHQAPKPLAAKAA